MSQGIPRTGASDRHPAVRRRLIVSATAWGVWAAMLAGALALVGHYGVNLPWWDDWEMVPTLSGDQPLSWEWLWEPYDEHRCPLSKLAFLAVARLSGGDFRAVMAVNVCLTAALAAGMMWTVRRLRGAPSLTDAFFPLVLLHWGQWASFLWAWQIAFILPAVLCGVLLLVVAGVRPPVALPAGLCAGLCLLLLPLCGAPGLPFAVLLALWLGGAALGPWSSGGRRGKIVGCLCLGLAATVLALVCLYVVGNEGLLEEKPAVRPSVALAGTAKFLSLGLGAAGARWWPLSGVLVAGLLALSGVAVLAVGYRSPQERLRALGLLLFLGAVAGMAAGVGWGRAADYGSDRAFSRHYVALAVLSLCAVYVAWEAVGLRGKGLLTWGLLGLAVAALPPNTREGLEAARHRHAQLARVERDVRSGLPALVLGEWHANRLLPYRHRYTGYLEDCMCMLCRARIGPWREKGEEPEVEEVRLPVPEGTRWERGAGKGEGLIFTLPERRFLRAIRLQLSYESTSAAAPVVRLSWRDDGAAVPPEHGREAVLPLEEELVPESYAILPPGSEPAKGAVVTDKEVTVWVNDTVGRLRLDPDAQTCVWLQVGQVDLLVPAGSQNPGMRGPSPP